MTTTTLKKSIHKYVDKINDEEYLSGLHTLLINKAKEDEQPYSSELIAMLEEREARYKRGETTLLDWEDVRDRLRKKLLSR